MARSRSVCAIISMNLEAVSKEQLATFYTSQTENVPALLWEWAQWAQRVSVNSTTLLGDVSKEIRAILHMDQSWVEWVKWA